MTQSEQKFTNLTFNPPDRIKALASKYKLALPQELIHWAFEEFGNKFAIATGFGAEGVALIDMAVKINPRVNIFYLDTGFLFQQTYELRRRIEDRYGIEIRSFQASLTPHSQEQEYGPSLWLRDPDLCCRIRKVEPLKAALRDLSAWMTAIRRDQTRARADASLIEWDYLYQLIKLNPLARWTKHDVWSYIKKYDLTYNPLHDQGYPSIGCTHCTRAVAEGEDDRAGRWSGRSKTECGLHYANESQLFQISNLKSDISQNEIQQGGD